MWKTLLIIVLLVYFLSSVLGKILRFLRESTGEAPPPKKSEKEGSMKIFIPEGKNKNKSFQGGEYTDYEEIK